MGKIKIALMIIAIVAIVAIVGSLIYYYVFFRHGIEKAEINLQEQKLELEKEKQRADEIRIEEDKEYKKQQELNKKAELAEALADLEKWHNNSLDQAYKDYCAQWYKECVKLGWEFTSPFESPLPKATVEWLNENYKYTIKRIDEQYQSQKDDIFKLYE